MLFSMNICLFVCPTAFFPVINEFFVRIAASKDFIGFSQNLSKL